MMHIKWLETQREKQFCLPKIRTFPTGASSRDGEAGLGQLRLTQGGGERGTLGGETP